MEYMGNRLTDEAIEGVAERFRILSEPIRLQILQALRDGELTVTELTREIEISQPIRALARAMMNRPMTIAGAASEASQASQSESGGSSGATRSASTSAKPPCS